MPRRPERTNNGEVLREERENSSGPHLLVVVVGIAVEVKVAVGVLLTRSGAVVRQRESLENYKGHGDGGRNGEKKKKRSAPPKLEAFSRAARENGKKLKE